LLTRVLMANTCACRLRIPMNMIYNSPNFCIVEFKSDEPEAFAGGYEIMDKACKREIFLGGAMAEKFRHDVTMLIAGEPSIEEVDDFLARSEEHTSELQSRENLVC